MARLVTSGFEIYVDTTATQTGPDGTAPSSPTLATRDTTVKRSGAASAKLTSTAGSLNQIDFAIAGAFDRGYWSRIYVRVTTLPTDVTSIVAHGTNVVQMDSSGRIFGFLNAAAQSPSINDGNWHRVEFYTKPSATQANRAWELRVDGATISSGTAQGVDSSNYAAISVAIGGSAVLNFDDLAVNDDQGASQNTWPGAGNVLLLLPTADSAVGTGWTLGTGTAISANSGSTAVKNTPPISVADLTAGSDTKQIRNATSNANVNYDATMTTYTAAGVASGATVNVVVPVVATAAPLVTSAKAGTVGVVSNPAIANVALGAGGTAGAFWAGAAAGTYPAGWKWSSGTITYAPTVTLGTAPVMRVTQVTASTRIAMVCFMGIYVDYTPAAVTAKSLVASGNRGGRGGTLPQRILR